MVLITMYLNRQLAMQIVLRALTYFMQIVNPQKTSLLCIYPNCFEGLFYYNIYGSVIMVRRAAHIFSALFFPGVSKVLQF